MRRPLISGLVFSLALAAGAPPAVAAVIDRIIAIVNDELLTLSDLQEEMQEELRRVTAQYVGEEQERQRLAAERRLLEALIDRRLQVQEARAQKLMPSAAEVTASLDEIKQKSGAKTDAEFEEALRREHLTLERFRRSIEEQIAVTRLIGKEVRSKIIIPEEDLRRYYDGHAEEFKRTPEVRLRHILVRLAPDADPAAVARARAKIDAARARVLQGADFGVVADQASEAGGARGGELGVVKKGELNPEIERLAFSLPLRQVSEPFRTAAGFHLLLVEERRDDPVIPYAEARERIRDKLLQERQEAKLKEWMAEVRKRAVIDLKGIQAPAAP
jgi:peptidyl-prolyl cis-trans isomerase SurA